MAKVKQKTIKEDSSEDKVIKDALSEFFNILKIDGDFELTLERSKEEAGNDEANVVLDTKDSGIVIGYHGEVLEALQLVSSLCVSKKLGRFIRVSIEVGDYKKNRTEFLKDLASQTKERVIAENKEYSLLNLKSWERRIIHVILQDDKEVETESVGEGKDRALIVRPRQ